MGAGATSNCSRKAKRMSACSLELGVTLKAACRACSGSTGLLAISTTVVVGDPALEGRDSESRDDSVKISTPIYTMLSQSILTQAYPALS